MSLHSLYKTDTTLSKGLVLMHHFLLLTAYEKGYPREPEIENNNV